MRTKDENDENALTDAWQDRNALNKLNKDYYKLNNNTNNNNNINNVNNYNKIINLYHQTIH